MKAPRTNAPDTGDAAPVIFAKTEVEQVRVELGQIHGHRLLNVRTYFLPEADGAKWLPTRRGATIRIADLPAFLVGLHRLARATVARGWLDPEDFDAAMEEQEERGAEGRRRTPARATARTKSPAGRTP